MKIRGFTRAIIMVFSLLAMGLLLACGSDETPHVLRLDALEGTLPIEKEERVLSPGAPLVLPEPTRAGHRFAGWYRDSSFAEAFKEDTMPAEDLTLYARWEIKEYTLEFATHGGTEIPPLTLAYGEEVEPPAEPKKEGHTFAGWYADEDWHEEYVFTTMPAHDATVHAKWRINEYTIVFDTDGGTEIAPITADFGADIAPPKEPTKEGHTFKGWYASLDDEEAYTFTTMPAEGLLLHARFAPNEYTIRFETHGGTEIPPSTVVYGTDITLPDAPKKEGYIFHGWYETADYRQVFALTTMPAEDLTLHAAYRDERGFFLESEVPETIDGVPVRERFGTNRQGFVEVGERLHYIGGVGPHLVDEEGAFAGFPFYSDLHISYDTLTQEWTLHGDLPAKAGFLDAVAHGTDIYILGGEWVDEEGYVRPHTLRYDTLSGEYHDLAEPPIFFQATNGSVIHEEKIYVFVGNRQHFALPFPSFERVKDTLVYCIQEDSWSFAAEQPFNTASGSAALVDGLIYVYRSRNAEEAHFAAYNPEEDEWNTDLAHPEHQISHSSSLAYDGKFLITGGWLTGIGTTSGAIQVYCPIEDAWEVLSVLKDEEDRGIGYVAVYEQGDSLYILGGESHDEEEAYKAHYGLYRFKEEWLED